MKKFASAQKFRVVSTGNVSFYTTAKQIRAGIGDNSTFNSATLAALNSLERTKFAIGAGFGDQAASGVAGMWYGVNVQIDMQ